MPPSSPFVLDRRNVIRGAGALGLAGLLPVPAWAGPFPNKAAVQGIVDRWVAEKKLPGAVVAYGEGTAPPEYVMAGTLAFDSTTKVDENTLWRMASLTKPITGMATMLLIAEGKLGIDQPVAELIPAFARVQIAADAAGKDPRPATRPMLVRHLMTHTSGVGSLSGAATDPGAPRTLAEHVDRLATVPLAAEPGTKYHYASGLEVAARIIEIVGGMPFEVFLERRIFAPLGMNSTAFWVPEANKPRLATLYAQKDGALAVTDPAATSRLLTKPAVPRASGGLVSTAHDYDRFLAMIAGDGALDGKRVLPVSAVRMGTSNLLPAGTDMSGFTSNHLSGGYGAGGSVTLDGLANAGNYGWGGASGTSAFVNMKGARRRVSSYTNIGVGMFSREVTAAISGTPVV